MDDVEVIREALGLRQSQEGDTYVRADALKAGDVVVGQMDGSFHFEGSFLSTLSPGKLIVVFRKGDSEEFQTDLSDPGDEYLLAEI